MSKKSGLHWRPKQRKNKNNQSRSFSHSRFTMRIEISSQLRNLLLDELPFDTLLIELMNQKLIYAHCIVVSAFLSVCERQRTRERKRKREIEVYRRVYGIVRERFLYCYTLCCVVCAAYIKFWTLDIVIVDFTLFFRVSITFFVSLSLTQTIPLPGVIFTDVLRSAYLQCNILLSLCTHFYVLYASMCVWLRIFSTSQVESIAIQNLKKRKILLIKANCSCRQTTPIKTTSSTSDKDKKKTNKSLDYHMVIRCLHFMHDKCDWSDIDSRSFYRSLSSSHSHSLSISLSFSLSLLISLSPFSYINIEIHGQDKYKRPMNVL